MGLYDPLFDPGTMVVFTTSVATIWPDRIEEGFMTVLVGLEEFKCEHFGNQLKVSVVGPRGGIESFVVSRLYSLENIMRAI